MQLLLFLISLVMMHMSDVFGFTVPQKLFQLLTVSTLALFRPLEIAHVECTPVLLVR